MGKKYTADTFEGAVTGTASGNVAKTGDTMSGDLNITKSSARLQLDGYGSVLNLRNGTGSNNPDAKITFGDDSVGFNTQALIQSTNNPGSSELMLQYGTSVSGFYNQVKIRSTNTYFTDPIRIGADSTSNELDDYEEGSYNVQFKVSSTNYGSSNWVSGGGTVWTDNSQYVKVGRRVTLFFDLEYLGIPSAISSSNSPLFLTNLPFTMAHGGGGNISFSWYNRNTSQYSPQNNGGATRLSPDTNNQATLINLEHPKYSSYWNAWYIDSMQVSFLPTAPPGGNLYMFGQFTYFTDN